MAFNITDSFGEAAGTAITSTTTDQGHAWVRPAGGQAGPYNVLGDGHVGNGIDAGEFAVVNTVITGSADYSVFGTADGAYQALIIRCDKDAGAPALVSAFYHGGAGDWRIFSSVANNYIADGAGPAPSVGSPQTFEIRATGDVFALYVGGVLRCQGTQTGHSAAGTGGISGSTSPKAFSMVGTGTASGGGGGGNANPVITSNGGGATASVNMQENLTTVTTCTATDADSGQTLTWSITGGADAAKFTIGSSSGVLSFLSAPNFEAPGSTAGTNAYIVIVQVSDGAGGTASQTITVNVTNDASETIGKKRIVCNMG